MTTQASKYANNSIAGNFTSPNNANGSDTGTFARVLNSFDCCPTGYMEKDMDNFSGITGTVNGYRVRLYASQSVGGTATCTFKVQTNGSVFCAGHTISIPTSANWTGYVSCTHTADYPNTPTEANSGDIEVRIDVANITTNDFVNIYVIEQELNYCPSDSVSTPSAPTNNTINCSYVIANRPSTYDGASSDWQLRRNAGAWTSGWTAIATTTIQSDTLSGGTGYDFDVRTRKSASGCWYYSSYGAYWSPTTLSIPGTPGAPSLAALTTTSIRITKPSTPSGSPTQWQARRSLDEWTSSWTVVGTTTIDCTTTLVAGTNYTFDVRFRNGSDCTGAWGTNASHYTICATVGFVSVNPCTVSGRLTVIWVDVDGGDNYRVRRDDTNVLTSTSQGTLYNDDTVEGGTSYYYDIQVQNPSGDWNTYSANSNTQLAIEIPDTCSAPAVSATAVETLTIVKPINPAGNGDGPTNWKVYTSADSYTTAIATRTVAQNDYDNIDLGEATTRNYKVAFTNSVGEAVKSTESSPDDTTWDYPGAPTDVDVDVQ